MRLWCCPCKKSARIDGTLPQLQFCIIICVVFFVGFKRVLSHMSSGGNWGMVPCFIDTTGGFLTWIGAVPRFFFSRVPARPLVPSLTRWLGLFPKLGGTLSWLFRPLENNEHMSSGDRFPLKPRETIGPRNEHLNLHWLFRPLGINKHMSSSDRSPLKPTKTHNT